MLLIVRNTTLDPFNDTREFISAKWLSESVIVASTNFGTILRLVVSQTVDSYEFILPIHGSAVDIAPQPAPADESFAIATRAENAVLLRHFRGFGSRGPRVHTSAAAGTFRASDYSHDRNLFAASTWEGGVFLWRIDAAGQSKIAWADTPEPPSPNRTLSFSEKGNWLAAGADLPRASVTVHASDTGAVAWSVKTGSGVRRVAWGGGRLAIGTYKAPLGSPLLLVAVDGDASVLLRNHNPEPATVTALAWDARAENVLVFVSGSAAVLSYGVVACSPLAPVPAQVSSISLGPEGEIALGFYTGDIALRYGGNTL